MSECEGVLRVQATRLVRKDIRVFAICTFEVGAHVWSVHAIVSALA
jgi:hypothetical protein